MKELPLVLLCLAFQIFHAQPQRSHAHLRTRSRSHGLCETSTIAGEELGENFGVSVSLSGNGTILAIGAERFGTPDRPGRVQVYHRLREWTQMGDDIVGPEPGHLFGTSVALSDNGRTLVVGSQGRPGLGEPESFRVYGYQTDRHQWEPMGPVLVGDDGVLGYVVAISGNGEMLAAGHPTHGTRLTGQVCVFKKNMQKGSAVERTGEWNQIGRCLNGKTAQDQFGTSVSLSFDGTVLAAGAPFNERNGENAGYVQVYRLLDGTWRPSGPTINGDEAGDNFGYSVSLSNDGKRLAVGARERLDTPDGNRRGYIQVFEFDGKKWQALSNKVYGTEDNDEFGHAVALSGDGTRLVAASPYYNAEYARLYKVGPTLSQIREDLQGDKVWGAPFGRSVAIDSRGDVVAVGAASIQGTTSDGFAPGYVRIYSCQRA